jgi:hypothetical protein
MNNVVPFPAISKTRQNDKLARLGEILQEAYKMGVERDDELEIWMATAGLALDKAEAEEEETRSA